MIDPVAIELGPLRVHWYGIIIAAAVLIAALMATRVAQWLNENPEDGWSMLLPVVIAGVIGARVYHVIHLWDHYAANPALIPQVWNGGLGIPGAIAGGALAIFISTRSRGINAARWLDIAAPGMLVAQAIGRLGNFVNQELYGPPISQCGDEFPPCLPFGVRIAADRREGTPWPADAFPVETTEFVPLFAYEGVLNVIGAVVLLFAIRRFGHRLFAGDVILMYVMWYGAVRTFLELYRVNNWTILGLPTAMWLGIIAFVLAGAWLMVRHARGWGSPLVRPSADERPDEERAATAQPRSEAPAG